jgi:sterol-4alpha-carboxylate 3-dehydrogenase (decarboxylating)
MSSTDALGSVLVLGGCGFLGHHIVRKLLEADYVSQVSVLDLDSGTYKFNGVSYIVGSITSREDVAKAINEAKPRVVFHTVSPQALGDPKLFE